MCMGKPVDVPGRSPWELKEVWRLAWEPLVLLSMGILSSDLGEPLHLLKCESWSRWGLDLVLLLNGISFDGDTCSLSIIMKVKVTQSCPPLRLHRLYSPWNSSGQNTGVGILSLLQGIFPTPRSPALQVDSLPAEPHEKPKNTGVGSLSLLWGIFPTQGSNQGLLHRQWILYQLSYEGSPYCG